MVVAYQRELCDITRGDSRALATGLHVSREYGDISGKQPDRSELSLLFGDHDKLSANTSATFRRLFSALDVAMKSRFGYKALCRAQLLL